ncbi:NAD(P)-binding domain superfamily [Arabidopsis suecica]|uniref:NAD(P)-binding domain superfamily n=1 Tax=Arabidopsis suecica TaxID=45249 RepID=A0A8T2C8J2_ARASU|nr:NAD(P)-binding domain superfamily [Arabidopsis suecica]
MNFASTFQRPILSHGGDGASYCFPNRLINPKGINTTLWDSNVHSCLRLRRHVAQSGTLNLNACFSGRFYSGPLHSTKSILGNGRQAKRIPFGFRLSCHGNDSLGSADSSNDRIGESSGSSDESEATDLKEEKDARVENETDSLEELKELLQKAIKELEVARLNSTMFEEKAQRISERAIALKDEAATAWHDVNKTLDVIRDTVDEESLATAAVQKATMALSLAEARLQVIVESLEAGAGNDIPHVSEETENTDDVKDKEEALLAAKDDIKECQLNLENCESQLSGLQSKKDELQKEVDKLNELAETIQISALKAEEDVANIMKLAEQAVAFELEATQRVNDAEIALQRAEKSLSISQTPEETQGQLSDEETHDEDEVVLSGNVEDVSHQVEKESPIDGDLSVVQNPSDLVSDIVGQRNQKLAQPYESSDNENGKPSVESSKMVEADSEKPKIKVQTKKQETQKDLPKEGSSLNSPKASFNKSSRFFSASFFSSNPDGTATVFASLVGSVKQQWPKLVLGFALLGAGLTLYSNGVGGNNQLLQQPDVTSTSTEDISSSTKPLIRQVQKLPKRFKKLLEMLPHQEVNEEEASLFDFLWLLLASVIFVPLFQKIPGGSPVLGYLAAGILIGPYGLSIIRNVHGTRAIAEFGVVFLLFNIGLELSVERLSSMKKYVFGLGSAQVLVTAAVVGLIAHYVAGQAGPAAIVIGNGLALSSTAVVLQVLQERGESTSRHGRASFSVLLFQDLAVVVLLILIPLISPNSSKGGIGFQAIAEALGLAAVKAAVAITAIIAGGRLLLRPIYKQIAENRNAEIFSANTLLVILGTSLLTARAGLSMALGAFLAGLLLAETEFSLQVESDIAPYRGLLLGLFFMTVGMSIDPKLLLSNFPVIVGTLGLLIVGKTMLVVIMGKVFGISIISAIRVGLLLAPGGEFAFVAFGEAVNQGIMSPQLSSLLFLVVGISMAITPWLAAGGQLIASRFELHDVRSLLPVESETDDLQDHIIICGFGRVGQIIAQLLSERLIPFVALDVSSDRVTIGRSLDLPVYFGDAGSREVLHKIGAERACAAVVALDAPGANYRCVWALSKYYPNVKTFVRAHDVVHGLNLEKAGATAVVPETLEPSLQLAAAVLAQAKLPTSEIANTINEFRTRHLSELTELCEASGSSLGYGYSRTSKPKPQPSDASGDNQIIEGGTVAI